MSNKSGTDIISTPQGGGALKGIGEKFSPDLHTGTGNYTVPIELPPGRNGLQPKLSLVYSTGNGNSPFGLGWSLSIPGVSRRTDKGVPVYDDDEDVFVLSGSEDLVRVTPNGETTGYRPRTEGTFARIEHIKDASRRIDYWQVRSKDGMVSTYGSPEPTDHPDDAVIADPKNRRRIHAWKLTETRDPFGNKVVFSYFRDEEREDKDGQHCWDQVYLSTIEYVDYGDPNEPDFLVSVEFDYQDQERPDPFSDYRAGFEIRTVKRCKSINIYTHSGQKTLTRTYHLKYLDEIQSEPAKLPHNGVSLLAQISVEGHRTDNGRKSPPQCLPPLTFKYGPFEPENRQFETIKGSLPAVSLGHPHYELVDLFGNGLPDIIEINGQTRYWRNLGHGKFDLPRSMSTAPPCNLADSGVQLIDADGNGRTDLLVSTANNAGYYSLTFHGEWDRRSYQRYQSPPSFNLEDPEVKLIDLTGDGVTDVIRSGSSLECFFNDPQKGWDSENTRRVSRRQLKDFPNINFSDPRVKWADMTGDGLTDVVLVHDGRIDYWPSLGYGDYGPRVTMKSTPRFPYGYDPRRILIGDVDGDGAADLIYVDNGKVTLWMNQSGNKWSEPIVIRGTPQVTDMDAVRLVDLFGTGVSGLLWSRDAPVTAQNQMHFLDFTAGHKPYLLEQINNNMGSVTNIGYSTSTRYYLQDQAQSETAWTSPLPFPVQVVAQVESIDEISGGKLTTEYTYHHGYWDGAEREFRGFGRVDQRDTEVFQQYQSTGLDDDEKQYNVVPAKQFSPPTEVRTWFHQGPVGPEYGDWRETDFSHEFWQDDPQAFQRSSETVELLKKLNSENRRDARDAVRALRGRVLRTELYALDGTRRQTRPYTVSENLYGLREEEKPSDGEDRNRIFFPFEEVKRTTQWERGDDPLTQLSFSGDYDEYGQPQLQLSVAVPRGRDYRNRLAVPASEYYLATRTLTRYAKPTNPNVYIFHRVAHTTIHQVKDDRQASVFELWQAVLDGKDDLEPAAQLLPDIVSHILNKYDGAPFVGLDIGMIGEHGALMRTEQLVLTLDTLSTAYPDGSPPYLTEGTPIWTSDYPQAFQDRVDTGYEYHPSDTNRIDGFYMKSAQKQYDMRGMLGAQRDSFGNQTDFSYDAYALFPRETQSPAVGGGSIRLTTIACYDYQAMKLAAITDPNGNRTTYEYTPLSLLKSIAVMGNPDIPDEGDKGRPGTQFEYNFESFQDSGQPIYTHTRRYTHHDTDPDDTGEQIETREYTDGFGRLLQTRSLAEDVLFGTDGFGNDVLSIDQTQNCPAVGKKCLPNEPNIIVSGWRTYDNKGRVIEKYEPFFSTGWEYAEPTDGQQGQKATLYHDPQDRVVRAVAPNDSERLTIFGIPRDLTEPSNFDPTPWESYVYDANDNAGRTPSADPNAEQYKSHWNTPSSTVVDALERTIKKVERNGANRDTEWYITRQAYDIRGNVIKIWDQLGRLAFEHDYDLANREIRTQQLDAGVRSLALDSTGNIIEQRDSKGALVLHSYDELMRPTHLWARDRQDESITLRKYIIYGDSPETELTEEDAQDNNLLNQPYQHYDEAGLLQFDQYDFKGNNVEKKRQVVSDSNILSAFAAAPGNNWQIDTFRVDWQPPTGVDIDSHAASVLDTTVTYHTYQQYDALSRMKWVDYPMDVEGNRKHIQPKYNRAGVIEQILFDGRTFVEHIAYNARGQRTLIAYGNRDPGEPGPRVMTRYAYDPQTFRLVRMRTEKFDSPDELHFTPTGAALQDLCYCYDLAGNIRHIVDVTPGCGVQNNPDSARAWAWAEAGIISFEPGRFSMLLAQGNALVRTFEYDPLYQLQSATGRECKNIPTPRPWLDAQYDGYNSGNHGTANQDNAPQLTATYTDNYTYDPAANMTSLRHHRHGSAWSRHFGVGGESPSQWEQSWRSHVSQWAQASDDSFSSAVWTNPPSNQLRHVGDNNLNINDTHFFDNAGNLVRENTARHFEWDHSNRMRAFRVQTAGAEPSKHAHYLYDSSGQRVKKLVRKQGGGYEVTVYIDGVFEYHRSGPTREFNTLHVLDNDRRIAVVRVGHDPDDATGKPVKYHLGDHLGSSTVVIDQAGSWMNREEYTSHGETSFGSFARKRYRYSGKERDEESGLYYYGARYYAAFLGRFMSPDPTGRIDSNNLYLFVFNNPASFYDKYGLKGESDNVSDVDLIELPPSKLSMADSKYANMPDSDRYARLGGTREAYLEHIKEHGVPPPELSELPCSNIIVKRKHIDTDITDRQTDRFLDLAWEPTIPTRQLRDLADTIYDQMDFGHWWIEVDYDKGTGKYRFSFGWWPAEELDNPQDILIGVEGCLNDDSTGFSGKDPYHGDRYNRGVDEMYHPYITEEGRELGLTCKDAEEIIIESAMMFTGEWRYPTGPNCHTFQEKLLEDAHLELREMIPNRHRPR